MNTQFLSSIRLGGTACVLGSLVGASLSPLPASAAATKVQVPVARSWMPDNGNGSFTNPLFYDEFSDPDIIRVGEDYYLAGTTMHAMPGLVVLHSRDLVNWRFLSYAVERLDLGPEFRLEGNSEIYGQGIWAPCIRHHKGMFYLFSNVNGKGLQVFTSRDPAGPWQHRSFDRMLHDLSVLFDDDGQVYAIFGYDEVRIIGIRPDMSGFVEGSERVLIPRGTAMGEGHHFYKIGGRYYIISADYAPVGRMQCARADRLEGPYESVVISACETMGTQKGTFLQDLGIGRPLPGPGTLFPLAKSGPNDFGAVPLHQGGIVDLPNGDWWGVSMMDFKSVGRTTFLSPITWSDGWPYFGLPGNLGRSPRTWIKPAVARPDSPAATYERSDDFSGQRLKPVWQWNHVPDDTQWSLTEKPGVLRLHTLPAEDLLHARNSLTQRAIGPVSTVTVMLDASGLKPGDLAGLGILNLPQAWIGVARGAQGLSLRFFNQATETNIEQALTTTRLQLRATGDFDADKVTLSYSTDGEHFITMGGELRVPYQLKTFQGVRHALFAFNTLQRPGGHADFESFHVEEPLADRSGNVPVGKLIRLKNLADGRLAWASPRGILHWRNDTTSEKNIPGTRFRVLDRGQGRIVLQSVEQGTFVTVVGAGLSADVRLLKEESDGSLFQWQDLLRGECMLLSMRTHRYVGLNPGTGEPYSANWPGTSPDRRDGTVLKWEAAEATQ